MKDFKVIVNEIILKQRKNTQITSFFKKASEEDIDELVNLIVNPVNKSEIYDREELEIPKRISLPQRIIDFYRDFFPIDNIMLNNGVVLLNIENIKRENLEYAPGAYLLKYGFITFASTIGGNALCFDLNDIYLGEPSIIIADHTLFDGASISIFDDGEFKEYELSYDTIKKFAKKISTSFTEFLLKIANDEFDEIEDYIS